MNEPQRIYFDHAATTPLDDRVLQAMLPYLQSTWGNPSSIYFEGREARKTQDAARREVASVLGARANDVVFTSGGSESDNLAIRGAAFASLRRRRACFSESSGTTYSGANVLRSIPSFDFGRSRMWPYEASTL